MKLGLDFRVKLFMTATVSYVMVTGDLYNEAPFAALCCYLLPSLLILSEGKVRIVLKWSVVFAIALILQKYYMGKSMGLVNSIVMFFSYIILKMGPGFMMGGYCIYSTGISDMVSSLKRGRVPKQIIIPIIVMARFFYTARDDYRQVKDAMYLNGLTGKKMVLQPLKLIEYRFVPLLMCLAKTADDVSVSAMTRGLQVGSERSSISNAKLKFRDLVFFLIVMCFLGLHIYIKYFK